MVLKNPFACAESSGFIGKIIAGVNFLKDTKITKGTKLIKNNFRIKKTRQISFFCQYFRKIQKISDFD